MSFNKLIFLFLMAVWITGCSVKSASVAKKDYYIQFNGEPTDAKMDEVESFILRKNIQTISGFDVIYGDDNYQRALVLSKVVHKRYGFYVSIKKVNSVGNNIFIVVKNTLRDDEPCYTFQLSDFNWYSSSKRELEKYMESEVCATNINDESERVK